MIETLLKIGDKLKIRNDIKHEKYHMKHDKESTETYILDKMPAPGAVVTIKEMVNIKGHYKYKIVEDPMFNYVDEMFDPELIEFLYNQTK